MWLVIASFPLASSNTHQNLGHLNSFEASLMEIWIKGVDFRSNVSFVSCLFLRAFFISFIQDKQQIRYWHQRARQSDHYFIKILWLLKCNPFCISFSSRFFLDLMSMKIDMKAFNKDESALFNFFSLSKDGDPITKRKARVRVLCWFTWKYTRNRRGKKSSFILKLLIVSCLKMIKKDWKCNQKIMRIVSEATLQKAFRDGIRGFITNVIRLLSTVFPMKMDMVIIM